MNSNRREFIVRSSLAVAAGAIGSPRLFAQQPAAAPAAADRSRVRVPAPQRRHVHGARRDDGLDGGARCRGRDRQPVRRHVEDVSRRIQADDRRSQDRSADQHASSSRSHRRQQGAAAVGRQDGGAGERPRSAAEAGGGEQERGRAGLRRHDVQDRLEGRSRKRGRVGASLRSRSHRRRRRHLLPEGERRAHGRPDVAPASPTRRSPGWARRSGTGSCRSRRP